MEGALRIASPLLALLQVLEGEVEEHQGKKKRKGSHVIIRCPCVRRNKAEWVFNKANLTQALPGNAVSNNKTCPLLFYNRHK
jgi:hypothetical protein